MNFYLANELIKKVGVDNKFVLTRIAIRRVRELVKEKNRMALINPTKLIPFVLEGLGKDIDTLQKSVPEEKGSL